MGNKHVEYSESYILKCRMLWYDSGCPSPRVACDMNLFPPDELGRVVEVGTLRHWLTEKDWYIWKDEQDTKLAIRIDDELLAHKMLLVKEQLAESREIRKMAFLHMKENPFDSSAAANSAFFKASEQERVLVGIEKMIEEVAKKQTIDLKGRLKELVERGNATIIDVAEVVENADTN